MRRQIGKMHAGENSEKCQGSELSFTYCKLNHKTFFCSRFCSAIAIFQFSVPISLMTWGRFGAKRSEQTHSKKNGKEFFRPLVWYSARAVSNASCEISDKFSYSDHGENSKWPKNSSRSPRGLIVPPGKFEFSRHFSLSLPNGILAFRRSIAECRKDRIRCWLESV